MCEFYIDFEDFANSQLCSAWVATAIVGSAVIGGAVSAYSANKAASAQEDATNKAAQLQQGIFNQTQNNLAPFIGEGKTAIDQLNAQLPTLTTPIPPPVMDQASLEKTPGYQFDLTQGLKATQNSAAARGLGVSGAALKGASTFATGLADNTQQTQFNIAQQQFQDQNTNQTNAYNRLKGLIDTGENAGAGQGTIGATTGANIGSSITAGGNAAAAGYNATGAAATGAFNNIGGYAAYKGLYGGTNPTANNVNFNQASGVSNGGFNSLDAAVT